MSAYLSACRNVDVMLWYVCQPQPFMLGVQTYIFCQIKTRTIFVFMFLRNRVSDNQMLSGSNKYCFLKNKGCQPICIGFRKRTQKQSLLLIITLSLCIEFLPFNFGKLDMCFPSFTKTHHTSILQTSSLIHRFRYVRVKKQTNNFLAQSFANTSIR